MGKVNPARFARNIYQYGVNMDVTTTGSVEQSRISINWSEIQTKLIQLAAKYTDYYASDIIILINHIQQQLDERNIESEYMFGFRESGVDPLEYVLNTNEAEVNHEYRAIWRLTVERSKGGYSNDGIEMSLHKVWYNPYSSVEE